MWHNVSYTEPRSHHVLTIQERGEDRVKMKQFLVRKSPPRPYYVLHISTRSSLRAHQAHPVYTTSRLQRPHEDQAVHATRVLRLQHVLNVHVLLYIGVGRFIILGGQMF